MKSVRITGFTLIELLIVVTIIGILAAIAVPNFLNAQMRARIARTLADQKAVATVLEQYNLDWNTYVEDHDYPTEPNERGFFRLTTPMPYLSALPVDVFASALTRNFSEQNSSFEFGSGNATSPGKQWPATAYLIISPGPDIHEQVQGNDEFPHGVTMYSYDPSNGLKSTGDIILLGGQWNMGTITRDGKWIAGGPRGR